jgi:NTP pyrophosphatase (non-canonical NTP hydrolase)
MEFRVYQTIAHGTAVYPQLETTLSAYEFGVLYTSMALGGEIGEFQNTIAKWLRGDFELEDNTERLANEIGDILWYLAELCTALEIDFGKVAGMNLVKLSERAEKGTIKGDGDNR